jgi:nitroreductase
MDVQQAIRTRRSVGKVKAEAPPREQIEAILAAATHAPNHFKVEPWKFFVLTGQGRDRLGEVMAEIEREKQTGLDGETLRKVAEGARAKALRSPVVITVAVDAPSEARVIALENLQAVSAAIQNMLLVAHSLGLGAMWRTGDVAYHPRTKALFGLGPEDYIAGFIYVGYPDMETSERQPTPLDVKTQWWGDSEGLYSEARPV